MSLRLNYCRKKSLSIEIQNNWIWFDGRRWGLTAFCHYCFLLSAIPRIGNRWRGALNLECLWMYPLRLCSQVGTTSRHFRRKMNESVKMVPFRIMKILSMGKFVGTFISSACVGGPSVLRAIIRLALHQMMGSSPFTQVIRILDDNSAKTVALTILYSRIFTWLFIHICLMLMSLHKYVSFSLCIEMEIL